MSDPIANPLDTAEDLLTSKVLQSAATLVKQLNSISKDGKIVAKLDEAAIQKNSKEFLETVNKVQALIQGEIVNLKDYIPAEKTAYGAAKEAEIMEEKVRFATEHLKATRKELEKITKGQPQEEKMDTSA